MYVADNLEFSSLSHPVAKGVRAEGIVRTGNGYAPRAHLLIPCHRADFHKVIDAHFQYVALEDFLAVLVMESGRLPYCRGLHNGGLVPIKLDGYRIGFVNIGFFRIGVPAEVDEASARYVQQVADNPNAIIGTLASEFSLSHSTTPSSRYGETLTMNGYAPRNGDENQPSTVML